jgi:hypothetical protein
MQEFNGCKKIFGREHLFLLLINHGTPSIPNYWANHLAQRAKACGDWLQISERNPAGEVNRRVNLGLKLKHPVAAHAPGSLG